MPFGKKTPSNNEKLPFALCGATSPAQALMTEAQLAEYLNVSVRTLQCWRWRGGGPSFLKIGGAVRYSPDCVAQWIEKQTRASTADPGPAAA
jgi:hypothetical protein